MNRDAPRANLGERRAPARSPREPDDAASSRRLARQAWLARAGAVTFLVGGAVVSYLFFTTI